MFQANLFMTKLLEFDVSRLGSPPHLVCTGALSIFVLN